MGFNASSKRATPSQPSPCKGEGSHFNRIGLPAEVYLNAPLGDLAPFDRLLGIGQQIQDGLGELIGIPESRQIGLQFLIRFDLVVPQRVRDKTVARKRSGQSIVDPNFRTVF